MTIAVKMLNDSIKKISETNTLLDMLLEFEKVLDTSDVYAYKNWIKGEILEGPYLDRHWVGVKLMYKHNDMPDPDGAKRLMARGGLVKYNKDTLLTPRRTRNFDDLTVEQTPDGRMRYKAKTDREPVWVVEVKLPRKYVDEFATEVVEADEDSYVDLESLNAEDTAQPQESTTAAMDTGALPGAGGI
jgi:hypothetical protein